MTVGAFHRLMEGKQPKLYKIKKPLHWGTAAKSLLGDNLSLFLGS